MSEQSFDPCRAGLSIEGSRLKSGSPEEKSKILDIGYLVLQLAELHKLGLRALQLVSLVYHLTNLAKNPAVEAEERSLLIQYCNTDGVGGVRTACNIMIMMQLCVEGIRDGYVKYNIPSNKEVALAAAATSEFVTSSYQVLSSALTSLSELPEEGGSGRLISSQDIDSASLVVAISEAISTGRRSLMELDEASVEFNAVCKSIAEWVQNANVTEHVGGSLHLYWPSNLSKNTKLQVKND